MEKKNKESEPACDGASIDEEHEEFSTSMKLWLERGKVPPSKFLYDTRGTALFLEVTKDASYYATSAESALLADCAEDLAKILGPNLCVIEFGCNKLDKVKTILTTLEEPDAFVAVDICPSALEEVRKDAHAEFPSLNVETICLDFFKVNESMIQCRGRKFGVFLGPSTNQEEPESLSKLLKNFARVVGLYGYMFITIDPKKDPKLVEKAYGGQVVAAFVSNLLDRMNRELGTNVEIEKVKYRACCVQNEDPRTPDSLHCNLEFLEKQDIQLGDEHFTIKQSEERTATLSLKYSEEGFTHVASQAGCSIVKSWTGPERMIHGYLLQVDKEA